MIFVFSVIAAKCTRLQSKTVCIALQVVGGQTYLLSRYCSYVIIFLFIWFFLLLFFFYFFLCLYRLCGTLPKQSNKMKQFRYQLLAPTNARVHIRATTMCPFVVSHSNDLQKVHYRTRSRRRRRRRRRTWRRRRCWCRCRCRSQSQ